MQDDLNILYADFRAALGGLPDNLVAHLTPPLHISVPEFYEDAEQRVLVVGQETMGWDFPANGQLNLPAILNLGDYLHKPQAVVRMVQGYEDFEFALHQRQHRNSPFWRAYRQIRLAIGDPEDGMATRVLWSNLFRMAVRSGPVVDDDVAPADRAMIQHHQRGLLSGEIATLQPTAVVFFTGPNYDDELAAEFPGRVLHPIHGFQQQHFACVQHNDLPDCCIRTYHPGYLQQANLWHIVNHISEAIAGVIPCCP